ncbi:hypothetical protein SLEP1_g31560 [Rubroshorea leprosula]|uniref:Uncharacterized protein n=1 Tax=Rubroshorea leprosula TaxID=152421 RepID=A0AAV5K3Q6_9ROSI|nr:hypothetical protein SLEP1_g31560 [Rubroshorea leprosula]
MDKENCTLGAAATPMLPPPPPPFPAFLVIPTMSTFFLLQSKSHAMFMLSFPPCFLAFNFTPREIGLGLYRPESFMSAGRLNTWPV